MYRYDLVAGTVSTRLSTTFCRESDLGVSRASLYDAVAGDGYA
jgi:hypothetical protein